MKRILFTVTILLFTLTVMAQVHVRGYTRANGTYVKPYTRSSPDHNPYNNYSFPGNTNPYTGKVATGNPDTYLNNYYNRNSTSSGNTSSGSSNIFNPTILPSTINNYPPPTTNDLNSLPPSSTLPAYNSLTPTNTTYNPYSNDNYNRHANNVLNAEKKYLKDAKGNYTGEYLKLVEEDDVIKKYKLYDVNNFPNGTLIVYSNGERVLFDVFGNIIARNKRSHKR